MLKNIFWNRNDKWLVQFGRYFVVGGLAFLVDYSFLYIFTESFHFYYLLSAALSFLMGLFVNYFFSCLWVFQTSSEHCSIRFLFFALIGIIGLGLNEFIIWFCTNKLALYYMFSKIIAAVIVFFWNFLARRKLMMKGM